MKAHADWLLHELPGLVERGVLDAAAAERLRAHYAGAAAQPGFWGRVLFPVLGAVLIGLGIVLLVAHNWDQLSRGTRLGLAAAPLLAGQLACAWTLLRASSSRAWREGSAAFTALAFAAALALVSQIYHFPGDLDRYLLTCSLVALPLVYLLDASLLAALCAAGFTGWAFASPDRDTSLFAVVGLFALLVPHLWQQARREPQGPRLSLTLAALVPLFFAATLYGLPHLPRLSLWWLAQFGAILVMLESQRAGSVLPLWRRPLAVYGGSATIVAALIGSFPDNWRDWSWSLRPEQLPQAWVFLGAGLAVLAVLTWRAWQRGDRLSALQAFPALLMALVASADSRALAVVLALLLSVYVLVLGLALIRHGMQARQTATATRGLFLITLLVLLRFVDTEWSFTARGIAFMLIGAAFLAVNLWLRRRVRG